MSKLFTLNVFFLLINTSVFSQQFGSLKDPRDGKVYKTVKIGEQEWMAENFDGTRFNNGDLIPQVKTVEEWRLFINEKKPAWCYNFTGEKSSNKLYNVWAVFDPRGLAPEDWHLPYTDEIRVLNQHFIYKVKVSYKDSVKPKNKIVSVDSVVVEKANGEYIPNLINETDDEEPEWVQTYEKAGEKLRAVGWGDGTNESGFNAKPFRCINGNTGQVILGLGGTNTYWWLQKSGGNLHYAGLAESRPSLNVFWGDGGKFIVRYLALSVRFIKY